MSKANRLLPRWMRFVRGVVDSEDIPLNLSRELLQDHGLIRKLNRILTSRILRHLEVRFLYFLPKATLKHISSANSCYYFVERV